MLRAPASITFDFVHFDFRHAIEQVKTGKSNNSIRVKNLQEKIIDGRRQSSALRIREIAAEKIFFCIWMKHWTKQIGGSVHGRNGAIFNETLLDN